MQQSKLIIDLGSGDFAPVAMLDAMSQFASHSAGLNLVAVGHLSDHQKALLPKSCDYQPVEDIVAMNDSPSAALRKGATTSMGKALQLLSECANQSVVISAGNTGAMIALTKHLVGMQSTCLKRPALLSKMPGSSFYCSDLGANLTLSADQMFEMARFCAALLPLDKPKVALVNIGKEAEKGPTVLKDAYALMKDCKDFDFHGFIEPHEVFSDESIDLLITDGLMGNIMLKSFEGAFAYTVKGLMHAMARTFLGKWALWNHQGLQHFIQMHQHHQVAILAGAKKSVLKVHGRADADSFFQSLLFAKQFMMEERHCTSVESVQ